MINKLKKLEKQLPSLLTSADEWDSIYIDYNKPYVARLWRQWMNSRIYLHKIYPCNANEAFLHLHPWKSAIKIISGQYEMGIGYSKDSSVVPDITVRLLLVAGSYYEMLSPNDWHYVCSIGGPSFSIMITDKPFNRTTQPEHPELKSLGDMEKEEILDFFAKEITNHFSHMTTKHKRP